MEDFLQYILQGVPVGCVYALVAVGIVLTYRTTGVFNLAFGAQAFASAAVFYELNVRRDWPLWAAFVLAVLVFAPLLGAVLDLAIFRHLRGSPWAASLVAAIGLFVAIPEIVLAFFGRQPAFAPPAVSPLLGIESGRVFRMHWGNISLNLSANELVTMIATVAVVIGLGLLLRYAAVGLQMRAVVESPRLVELAGTDARRVGLASWMLSSLLAGLAGVLLAPLFAAVDVRFYTTLLVAGIAAAAFGRLQSIWLAFAGAILLGVAQQVVAGELPPASVLARGIRPSLPFLMLFLVLVLLPAIKGRREAADPLAGVDPPSFAPAHSYKDEALRRLSTVLLPASIVTFIAVNLFFVSDIWVRRFTLGLTFAVLFLSITVFTGLSGQVSLGQAAFAGLGAFATGQLATNQDLPVLVALLAGGALAAVIGALLAIPAVRLAGIFLTLATLAFALFTEAVVFPLSWVSGGSQGVAVPRPSGFASDQVYFLLTFALFGVVALVAILVRNGTTGRFLAAMRGSETAAAAIGIDARRQRVVLFALSAGIAGVGGGMLGMLNGRTSPNDWIVFLGAFWVVIVVTIGVRTVDGAVTAGMAFVIVQWLLGDAWRLPTSFAIILFGLGAITYARHPEGVAEWRTRISIEDRVRNRRTSARRRALAGEAVPVSGYRPIPVDVGLSVVSVGLWTFAVVAQAYATARRALGGGISAAAGVALHLLVVPSLFLVPHRLGRVFQARGEDPPVSWRIGIGPTVVACIAAYIFYRYWTVPLRDIPTDFGLAFAGFIVAVTLLNWVGQIRGALNLLAVDSAEERVGTPERVAVPA